jgi:Uma2 family endonuclease
MDLETGYFESEPWCTLEEFDRFIRQHENERERYELLNGRITMTPPPAWPHSEVDVLVARVLANFVVERQLGRVLHNGSVALPSGDVPGPDIAFVSRESWARSGPHRPGEIPRVVPDLVVEVLSDSTSSYDRGEKKAIYERNGVREYWIVDPKNPRIARFVLDGATFGPPRIFGIDDAFESVILEGLRFPVRDIVPEE